MLMLVLIAFLSCGFASAKSLSAIPSDGWEQPSRTKAIYVRFPDNDAFPKPTAIVAIVPGCWGFDGQGYIGQALLDKSRASAFRTAVEAYYQQKIGKLLEAGFAVAKIDTTRESTVRGEPKGGFDCQKGLSEEVFEGSARVVGNAITTLHRYYDDRVASRDIRVIATDSGGGAIMAMFSGRCSLAPGERPKRVVLLYPTCASEMAGWQPKVSTLMFLGAKDRYPTAFGGAKRPLGLAAMCGDQTSRIKTPDLRPIVVYPKADHAFDIAIDGSPGAAQIPAYGYSYRDFAYDPQAAADAWTKILDFLK